MLGTSSGLRAGGILWLTLFVLGSSSSSEAALKAAYFEDLSCSTTIVEGRPRHDKVSGSGFLLNDQDEIVADGQLTGVAGFIAIKGKKGAFFTHRPGTEPLPRDTWAPETLDEFALVELTKPDSWKLRDDRFIFLVNVARFDVPSFDIRVDESLARASIIQLPEGTFTLWGCRVNVRAGGGSVKFGHGEVLDGENIRVETGDGRTTEFAKKAIDSELPAAVAKEGQQGQASTERHSVGFAGDYQGMYGGSEIGMFTARIESDGRFTATIVSPTAGAFTATGTVDRTGRVSARTRGGAFTISFEGRFQLEADTVAGSGEWKSSSGFRGTWKARRGALDMNELAKLVAPRIGQTAESGGTGGAADELKPLQSAAPSASAGPATAASQSPATWTPEVIESFTCPVGGQTRCRVILSEQQKAKPAFSGKVISWGDPVAFNEEASAVGLTRRTVGVVEFERGLVFATKESTKGWRFDPTRSETGQRFWGRGDVVLDAFLVEEAPEPGYRIHALLPPCQLAPPAELATAYISGSWVIDPPWRDREGRGLARGSGGFPHPAFWEGAELVVRGRIALLGHDVVSDGDYPLCLKVVRASGQPQQSEVPGLQVVQLVRLCGRGSVSDDSGAVRRFGYDETTDMWAARLRSEDPLVRQAAAVALGYIAKRDREETKAVPALIGALTDESPEVRLRAAEALGRLGRAESVNPLQRLSDPANEKDEWVVEVAKASLDAIRSTKN